MKFTLDIKEVLEKGPHLFVYVAIALFVTILAIYVLKYVGIAIGPLPTAIVAIISGIIAAMLFKDRLGAILGTLTGQDFLALILFSALAFGILGTIVSIYGQVGMTASVLGTIEIPSVVSFTNLINLFINNAILGAFNGLGIGIGYMVARK